MRRSSVTRDAGWAVVVVVSIIAFLAAVDSSRGDAAEPAPPAPTPSPVVVEVRRLVDAAMYREALDLISKELADARRGTEHVSDRAELLLLKGESLLRMGNNVPATDAFQKAADAAASATPPDVKGAGWARANALLCRKSPKHVYRPAAGRGEPIDVADPAARQPAFAAMHEELAKTLGPKIAAARKGTVLPPMFDLVPAVSDLGALEFAATGAAPEAKAILEDFGAHVHHLMANELRRLGYRVQQIDDLAASPAGWDNALGGGVVGRRGLYTKERTELVQTIKYIQQIEKAALKARATARQLGFQGERWEPVIADAGELADRAQAVQDFGN